MKTEFERKLKEEGYSYNLNPDGYYKISKINRIDLPIKVQLVESKPINHGSQNGNEIDGIGYFHFSLNSEQSPNNLVFAFKHLRNDTTEYMIILTAELRKRLEMNIIRYMSGEYFEISLWLMDGHLYDTTNLGLEGEWFYLSKGIGGRMIDQAEWNYTSFWNN